MALKVHYSRYLVFVKKITGTEVRDPVFVNIMSQKHAKIQGFNMYFDGEKSHNTSAHT